MNREDIDLLLEACGTRSPLALDIEQPVDHVVKSITLDFPFATIGRTATNHVVLDDVQVSRRHAYLQVIDGRVFCVDFRTRTGTHWDGGSGRGWLNDAQAVKIGNFTIRLHPVVRTENARWPDSGDLTDPLHSIRAEHDPLPRLTLQFIEGVRERTAWKMQRVLALVGGSPQCKVQLIDPRVSKYHCSLLRTPLGIWVIDLLGRGGVRLNGKRVAFGQIHDGDELQVGGVKARVDCEVSRGNAVAAPVGTTAVEPVGATAVEELCAAPESVGNLSGSGATGIPSALVIPGQSTGSPQRVLLPDGSLVPAVPHDLDLVPRAASPGERHSLMTPPQLSTDLKLNDPESLVNTLLYHFGQVQKQMAEQFNQAIMTMVQMFSAFHRDQMDLVRAELDRLHDLNQEIVTIQSELSKRHPPRWREITAGDSHIVAARSDAGFALDDVPHEGFGATEQPASPADASADHADPSNGTAASYQPNSKPRRNTRTPEAVAGMSEDSPQGVVNPKTVAASASDDPPHGRDSAKDPASVTGAPAGEEVHAWLCHRMEMIRAEQQTLWQKILTTVRSKVTGNL